jgi:CxxC motif-containing protein (DUF1111 family)
MKAPAALARRCLVPLVIMAAAPLAPGQVAPPVPLSSGGPEFGQSLPGLTAAEQKAFLTGLTTFAQVETPATGLGPIYNNVSCTACHEAPSAGGLSNSTVTRFGQNGPNGFNPLTEWDGTLLHTRAISPILLETIPAAANVTAKRLVTPLYGAGLIEAIPDQTIVLNSQQAKFPGVKGTVAWVTDVATGVLRVGRFGWKAEYATLLSFCGDEYNNEMGITNAIFPTPHAPDGNTALLGQFVSLTAPPKDVIDPVTGEGDVDRVADYLRYLGPPPPNLPIVPPLTAEAVAGAQVFTMVGCASCHTPSMNTGPNAIPALSNQAVPLYSDLLLHDMGSLNDGIAQGAASPDQMRTAPLWGLRTRLGYLHDGRAATVNAAILAHDGEAQASREAYIQLAPAAQQELLAFLNTL